MKIRRLTTRKMDRAKRPGVQTLDPYEKRRELAARGVSLQGIRQIPPEVHQHFVLFGDVPMSREMEARADAAIAEAVQELRTRKLAQVASWKASGVKPVPGMDPTDVLGSLCEIAEEGRSDVD